MLSEELYIDKDKIVRCYRNEKIFDVTKHYENTNLGTIISYTTKNKFILGKIKCECHQIFDLIDFISSLPTFDLSFVIKKFNLKPKFNIGDKVYFIKTNATSLDFYHCNNNEEEVLSKTLTGLSYSEKEKYIKNFFKSNSFEDESVISGLQLCILNDEKYHFNKQYKFAYLLSNLFEKIYEDFACLNNDIEGKAKVMDNYINKLIEKYNFEK